MRNVIETIRNLLTVQSLPQLPDVRDRENNSTQRGCKTELTERSRKNSSVANSLPLKFDRIISVTDNLPNEDKMNLIPPQKTEITLQQTLDSLAIKETLQLFPANGEYEAPINIDRPLTLDGQGSTIWAKKGPVVSVRSDGVCLRNLRIEVTEESKDNCSISVKSGYTPQLEEVEVRGNVIGIAEEEGDWNYPFSLNLGQLAYGCAHNFILRIIIPIACRIEDNISGLEFTPRQLQPGANEIHLNLEIVPQDTLIYGSFFLVSPTFKRRIAVNARIVKLGDRTSTPGKIIWEAEGWSHHKVEIQKKRSAEPEKTQIALPETQQPKPSLPYPKSQLFYTPKAPRIKRNQMPSNSSWAISVPERYANAPELPSVDRETDTSRTPKIAAIFDKQQDNFQDNPSATNQAKDKQNSNRETNSKTSVPSRTTSLPNAPNWLKSSNSQDPEKVKSKRRNPSVPQHFLATEGQESVKSETNKPKPIDPLFGS